MSNVIIRFALLFMNLCKLGLCCYSRVLVGMRRLFLEWIEEKLLLFLTIVTFYFFCIERKIIQ